MTRLVTHYILRKGDMWQPFVPPTPFHAVVFRDPQRYYSLRTETGEVWTHKHGWGEPVQAPPPSSQEPQLKGLKHDASKPPLSLLPGKALWRVAEVLDYGAKKYAAHNWRKGLTYNRLLSAALRHLTALMDGEEMDSETGLHHAAHAVCELLFLLQFHSEARVDLDDLYSQGLLRADGSKVPPLGEIPFDESPRGCAEIPFDVMLARARERAKEEALAARNCPQYNPGLGSGTSDPVDYFPDLRDQHHVDLELRDRGGFHDR